MTTMIEATAGPRAGPRATQEGPMRVTYDADADVLTLEIVPGGGEGGKTVTVTDDLTLELDDQGKPLELVLERASAYYPRAELEEMDTPAIELSLAEAAKEAGTLSSTLRNQINLGRLQGIKRGRDWVISSTELANYLANKDPRGRKPGAAKKKRAVKRRG